MNKIYYSVIIPAYNAENTLATALESAINQTFNDYEIIIVNDGSTDSTPEIVDSFLRRENNIKSVNQENKGLGGARNSGIRVARGDYLAFLDADDLWYPDKLEKVAEVISGSNGQFDVICHDENLVFHGKKIRVNTYGPHSTFEDLLLKGNCLSPSATVVKGSTLTETGLFSEDRLIHGVEDYDLWLRLAKDEKSFYFLHEPLGEYHVKSGNMTRDVFNFTNRVLKVRLSHYCELSVEDQTKYLWKFRMQISKMFLRAGAKCLFLNRDAIQASKLIIESLRLLTYVPDSIKDLTIKSTST